jgi:hypothetical protein
MMELRNWLVPGLLTLGPSLVKCAVDLPRSSRGSALQKNGSAGNIWRLLLSCFLFLLISIQCLLTRETSKTVYRNTNHDLNLNGPAPP